MATGESLDRNTHPGSRVAGPAGGRNVPRVRRLPRDHASAQGDDLMAADAKESEGRPPHPPPCPPAKAVLRATVRLPVDDQGTGGLADHVPAPPRARLHEAGGRFSCIAPRIFPEALQRPLAQEYVHLSVPYRAAFPIEIRSMLSTQSKALQRSWSATVSSSNLPGGRGVSARWMRGAGAIVKEVDT